MLGAFFVGMCFAARRCGAALVLAVSLACAAPPSMARPIPEPPDPLAYEPAPPAVVAQRGPVSLSQAIAMAQRRFHGRVSRAETVMRGGRTVHEIRILGEDGRVRMVRIDAETGAFL